MREVDGEQRLSVLEYDGSFRQIIDRAEQRSFPARVHLGAASPKQTLIDIFDSDAPSSDYISGNPQRFMGRHDGNLMRLEENTVGLIQTFVHPSHMYFTSEGQLVTRWTKT